MPAAAVRRSLPIRVLVWAFHLALPLLGLWLLIARPELDLVWQHQVSHFWLVAGVAGINIYLAIRMYDEAERREDARLLLIALGFITAAGFFALHALATPRVIVSASNAGFQIASPVGIALGSIPMAVSASDLAPSTSAAILDRRAQLRWGVIGLLFGWAFLTLFELPPLYQPLASEAAFRGLVPVAVAGAALYLFAAVRYFGLYRRRRSAVLLGFVTAFVLLAESLAVIVVSRDWALSWWEWHVLLLAGFGYLAYSAAIQRRAEGAPRSLFASVGLEEALQRLQVEQRQAVDELVDVLRARDPGAGESDTNAAVDELAQRFDLTHGQREVLHRAAGALAAERDNVRRVEQLLERYLSPNIASALQQDEAFSALGGEVVEATVLFADLRGFTSFSERVIHPGEVVELLNRYFGIAVPILLDEGATIDKFVGDAMLAIFNWPRTQPDHALRAVRAGSAIQLAISAAADGHPDWPRFRMGINTGPALIGNIGSGEFRNLTAIGDTVNLASRLETAAEPGQIVLGPTTVALVRHEVETRGLGPLTVKGREAPVEASEFVQFR